MIEIFLFGIVLGLIPITLAGLFVTAYLQYRRGDQSDLWLISISFFDWPPPFFYPWEVKFRFLFNKFRSHFVLTWCTKNEIALCRIWTYDIGFWRPAFYRTELRALFFFLRIDKTRFFLFVTRIHFFYLSYHILYHKIRNSVCPIWIDLNGSLVTAQGGSI